MESANFVNGVTSVCHTFLNKILNFSNFIMWNRRDLNFGINWNANRTTSQVNVTACGVLGGLSA